MGEAARKFLDRLVLRVGGTASERARYRCYAESRLACVNADGAARLVLSFKNHIRRRGGTVARTATDLRLPQVPEASYIPQMEAWDQVKISQARRFSFLVSRPGSGSSGQGELWRLSLIHI